VNCRIAAVPLFPNAEIIALAEEIPLIEGKSAGKGPLHLTRFPP
jgi:hypothetical protein